MWEVEQDGSTFECPLVWEVEQDGSRFECLLVWEVEQDGSVNGQVSLVELQ